jgi:methionyl aminopeptidase
MPVATKTIPLLTPAEAELAYAAAQCAVEVHRRMVSDIKLGMTLAQLDQLVAKHLTDLRCTSCFRGYKVRGLPAFPSYSCLSLNHCVVHGTAGYHTRPLVEGDLLKLDIGVSHKEFIGDVGWTYAIKHQTNDAKRLMDVGKESLRLGCAELHPANMFMHWAKAVQEYVERQHGLHLIRGLGGHGIGRALHGAPFVSNVMPASPGDWPDATLRCSPGIVIAVEPMLALGTGSTKQGTREWPVFTADGSLSSHYEHDVLITTSGPRILSEGMDDLPAIIG